MVCTITWKGITVLKHKMLWIVSIILVESVAVNLFLGLSYLNLQNDFNSLSNEHKSLVNERDALKIEVYSLVNQRDTARAELDRLNGTYNVAVADCDALRDSLEVELEELTDEMDSLKATVSTLVDERDAAKSNEDVLQGQVNQLNTDIAAIENERDLLKDQVNTLIVERDEARAETNSVRDAMESVRTRIRLVDHQASSDGTRITFSGYAVNTGIETLTGVTFHVTGYDLTSSLVIDLYALNLTIHSGYYIHYSKTIEYAPLVLSSWSVELLWGDLLPNNE
jgi:predicted  nucleic acid-binding Zn-ribbon protein